MPYARPREGWTRFTVANSAYWWKLRTVNTVLMVVTDSSLDTVEGRRDAITAMTSAVKEQGSALFVANRRFPDGWDDAYLTSFDQGYFKLWNHLIRLLEQRETLFAKDTQAGRQQQAPGAGVTSEQNSQAIQDNRKAIMETISKFNSHIQDVNNIWTQEKFEFELRLTWTAGGDQANAAQQQFNQLLQAFMGQGAPGAQGQGAPVQVPAPAFGPFAFGGYGGGPVGGANAGDAHDAESTAGSH